MKRNPDVKDFLLRTITDGQLLCWYNVGIKRNGKQNGKMKRKWCHPFLTNSFERYETPINRPDISLKKIKTVYDRLLFDKLQSITGKLPVIVNEFEIVIT